MGHPARAHPGRRAGREPKRRLLALVFAAAACATQGEVGFSGNTYRNPEAGLRVSLPTGWVFAPPERYGPMLDAGREAASKALPSLAFAATESSEVLFVMQSVVALPGARFPATVAAVRESFPGRVFGMTHATYALAVLQVFNSMVPLTHRFDETRTLELAGRDFFLLPARFEVSDIRGRQDYYIHAKEEGALVLIATYAEEEQASVVEALEAIRPLR